MKREKDKFDKKKNLKDMNFCWRNNSYTEDLYTNELKKKIWYACWIF